MSENSKIEWTDHTFNPWWGCTNVSPACDHCYAEAWAKRTGHAIWGKDSSRRFFGDHYWNEPLKWNAKAERDCVRRRVFCGSMCDVMEDRRDLDPHRTRLYPLIERTPALDWLLLTKRPQNFLRFLPPCWLKTPRQNVWLMTTVESPAYLWRIDALKTAPAVVHGLSIEPLLEPIPTLGEHLDGIEWVICGGESGPQARPMQLAWVRSIREQCITAAVAFHFKQWGEHGADLVKIGKKHAGRSLDGRTWDQLPAVR
jgi:protein gp37